MKKLRKNFALCLLVALAPILVPRVYFHSLIHSDGHIHPVCNSKGPAQVGLEHEHCSLLQFSTPSLDSFVPDFQFDFTSFLEINIFHFDTANIAGAINLHDLRGPPMI